MLVRANTVYYVLISKLANLILLYEFAFIGCKLSADTVRSTVIISGYAVQMLSQQVDCLGLSNKQAMLTRFQEAFRTMWAQNGDHISRMYLGTGALDGKAKVQFMSLMILS